MLVNNFMGEHKGHYSGGGKKHQYALYNSRTNISIEKISILLTFVPEAILYVHIRRYTQGGAKHFFEMSCSTFEKIKVILG